MGVIKQGDHVVTSLNRSHHFVTGSFKFTLVSGLQNTRETTLQHRSLGNTHKHPQASTHCSPLLNFYPLPYFLLLLFQLLGSPTMGEVLVASGCFISTQEYTHLLLCQ